MCKDDMTLVYRSKGCSEGIGRCCGVWGLGGGGRIYIVKRVFFVCVAIRVAIW